MPEVPRSKAKPILATCLVLMLGISVWISQSDLLSDKDKDEAIVTPIDAEDEADRFIQMASQNYFYHEFDEAAQNYQKAIALFEERKNFKRAAKTYEALGDLYKFANRSLEAEQNYLSAIDYHHRIHNPIGEGRAMKSIADFYRYRLRLDEVEGWYDKAAAVVQDLEPHIVKAKIYETRGHYFLDAERFSEAIDSFKKAQKTFANLGYPPGYDRMAQIIKRLERNSLSLKGQSGY